MDDHDINRVVKAFAAAAVRCKEGGLDGIETHAGGHMIGQFLSPISNRRTDRFGGSLENRMRFPLMVHEAIRKAVGDDFVVGIRMAVDEGPDGGMGFEESLKVAQALRDIGGIDFFNAIYGMMDTTRGLAEDAMPGMGSPLAPRVEPVGRFRQELDIPVFHAARISDAASARYAIREGKMDMAGMTRAQIADPYLSSKIASGRENEIRPCVGATHCQSPHRPACLHNPATGRETVLPQVFTKPTAANVGSSWSAEGPQALRQPEYVRNGVMRFRCLKRHPISAVSFFLARRGRGAVTSSVSLSGGWANSIVLVCRFKRMPMWMKMKSRH